MLSSSLEKTLSPLEFKIPASAIASLAAGMANREALLRREISLSGTSVNSGSVAWAPFVTRHPSTGMQVISPRAESPRSRDAQVVATSPPSGDTQPQPVMTTSSREFTPLN